MRDDFDLLNAGECFVLHNLPEQAMCRPQPLKLRAAYVQPLMCRPQPLVLEAFSIRVLPFTCFRFLIPFLISSFCAVTATFYPGSSPFDHLPSPPAVTNRPG